MKTYTLTNDSDVESLSFNADGSRLASSHSLVRLAAWNTADGSLLWTRPHQDQLMPLFYLPDGSLLANWLGRGPCVLSGQDGAELRSFSWANALGFTLMGIAADGTCCAVADEAGNVRIIDLPAGPVEPRGKILPGTPENPVFDAAGRFIVFAMQLGPPIFIYERAAGKIVGQLIEEEEGPSWKVIFLGDGRLVGVCGRRVAIWDRELQERGDLPNAPSDTSNLCPHPDGHHFITWAYDHTVRLWDADSGTHTVLLDVGDVTNPARVAIDPTGRKLAVACYDQTLRLYDLSQ